MVGEAQDNKHGEGRTTTTMGQASSAPSSMARNNTWDMDERFPPALAVESSEHSQHSRRQGPSEIKKHRKPYSPPGLLSLEPEPDPSRERGWLSDPKLYGNCNIFLGIEKNIRAQEKGNKPFLNKVIFPGYLARKGILTVHP